ncbi:hemagglutinin [Ralstonia solanacearum]|uniref:hypothetical protein n=1 Tax=Ralstonia pseudosolanacearum TaxID=1310165 RepID=UPI0002C06834|nr:hypothetical protein [Ralstonia pseudosolanacearum]AGH86636.1 putative hemagglutin-related protein [Ralstonia pseudosolanacearum FQY_4]ANH36052.1 hemagglutin-related protein [Ralstonia solanacearum]ESS50901.1 hemagglutinin-related protein [Ralstonia solanacearum SD54]AOE92939.1 hypothetical protein LBM341_04690 [Ralstonia solanacearum]KAF3459514.1 hemagglutinin [Ralstonia solanacearum]
MAIGGALDSNRVATGSAATVNNNSASIESLCSLALVANRINNTNEHFSTGCSRRAASRTSAALRACM